MGRQGASGDQLRYRIRAERERRGWSQFFLAGILTAHGMLAHPTTIAKIESGKRDVRVDELAIFADAFGMSADALIGRRGGGDLAWAASKLTSDAAKAAREIQTLNGRIRGGYDDVRAAAPRNSDQVDGLLEITGSVILHLSDTQTWMTRLANQFPLPTDFGPATKGEGRRAEGSAV